MKPLTGKASSVSPGLFSARLTLAVLATLFSMSPGDGNGFGLSSVGNFAACVFVKNAQSPCR
jgi:hypothetical protein